MILGELKGVVSPESWTSECSEGKSLETSDRFRPASESSVLSSDMAGQARELGVSVEVRGLSAQRGERQRERARERAGQLEAGRRSAAVSREGRRGRTERGRRKR